MLSDSGSQTLTSELLYALKYCRLKEAFVYMGCVYQYLPF